MDDKKLFKMSNSEPENQEKKFVYAHRARNALEFKLSRSIYPPHLFIRGRKLRSLCAEIFFMEATEDHKARKRELKKIILDDCGPQVRTRGNDYFIWNPDIPELLRNNGFEKYNSDAEYIHFPDLPEDEQKILATRAKPKLKEGLESLSPSVEELIIKLKSIFREKGINDIDAISNEGFMFLIRFGFWTKTAFLVYFAALGYSHWDKIKDSEVEIMNLVLKLANV